MLSSKHPRIELPTEKQQEPPRAPNPPPLPSPPPKAAPSAVERGSNMRPATAAVAENTSSLEEGAWCRIGISHLPTEKKKRQPVRRPEKPHPAPAPTPPGAAPAAAVAAVKRGEDVLSSSKYHSLEKSSHFVLLPTEKKREPVRAPEIPHPAPAPTPPGAAPAAAVAVTVKKGDESVSGVVKPCTPSPPPPPPPPSPASPEKKFGSWVGR